VAGEIIRIIDFLFKGVTEGFAVLRGLNHKGYLNLIALGEPCEVLKTPQG